MVKKLGSRKPQIKFIYKNKNDPSRDLPALVLVNILSRLPIKSILNCKRVCKEWYKLIKEPYFVNTYFANPSFVSILFSVGPLSSYLLELRAQHDYKAICVRNRFKFPLEPNYQTHIIGCCNGLLCLLRQKQGWLYDNHHELYISNPMLGEYVEILNLPSTSTNYVTYGFGCSAGTDQFKILRVAKQKYNRQPVAAIYRIGVDRFWRDVGEAPYPASGKICGITLHGALHWIADGDNKDDLRLIAFDIKDEKVSIVPSPRGLSGIFSKEVAVLRNCLCIFETKLSQPSDIWWMKEYGIVESWTRYRISVDWILSGLFPITIRRDREILMGTPCGKLFSYDPETSKSERTKVRLRSIDRCKAIVYVPSFTSVKSLMGISERGKVILL